MADIFASPDTIVAFGRQTAKDAIRTYGLQKLYSQNADADPGKQTTTRGILVGSADPHERSKIATALVPTVSLTLQTAADEANMAAKAMAGNYMLSEGTASATTTTLGAAVTSRHQRYITVASVTGISIGDVLQVGVLATPGTPLLTDNAETHTVLNVGAHNASYSLIISATGGTFTLTGSAGGTTAAINYNDNAATIQTAVRTLTGLSLATVANLTPLPSGATAAFTITSGANAVGPTITTDDTSLTVAGTAYAYCQQDQIGGTATTVTFKGALLNTHANAEAVAKLDVTNSPILHYAMHAGNSNPQVGDYWTMFVSYQGPTESVSTFYYNGRVSANNPSFQSAQIPTRQVTYDASRTNRKPSNVDMALKTFVTQAADYIVSPVSGTLTIGGVSATIDSPQSIQISETTDLYKHQPIGNFYQLANLQTGHHLTAQAEGVFSKNFSDKINYNNTATNVDVDPAIYAPTFDFVAQAGTKVASSASYYAVEENWPDTQLTDYKPTANGADVVKASFAITAIANPSTNVKRFYTKYTTSLTSDVYSAK